MKKINKKRLLAALTLPLILVLALPNASFAAESTTEVATSLEPVVDPMKEVQAPAPTEQAQPEAETAPQSEVKATVEAGAPASAATAKSTDPEGQMVTELKSGLVAAASTVLDAPVAIDDEFLSTTRGAISGNVLTNDSWDADETATVTAAEVTYAYAYQIPETAIDGLDPSVAFTDDGQVTLNFGDWEAQGHQPAPSLIRMAWVRYTLTDSAGQSAQGVATFTERNDTANPIVADDENAIPSYAYYHATIQIQPALNDTLGDWSAYTSEILSQPTTGTVSASSLNFFEYKDSRAVGSPAEIVTFSYRTHLTADPSVTSNTATVTLHLAEVRPAPTNTQFVREAFMYKGGDTTVTFPVLSDIMRDGLTQNYGFVPAIKFGGSNESVGKVTDNGDGTITFKVADQFPASGSNSTIALYQLVDETGNYLGSLLIRMDFGQANDAELATSGTENDPAVQAADDDVWVVKGGSTDFRPFLNDNAGVSFWTYANACGPTYDQATKWEFLSGPWDCDTVQAKALLKTTPMLGELFHENQSPALSEGQRFGLQASVGHMGANAVRWFESSMTYYAGDTVGTEVLNYQICNSYPIYVVELACDDANITVHVSPNAAALDDSSEAETGKTAAVPVLGNDTYTDKPAYAAKVTLTDIPDGVTAMVNADRTVDVSIPASYNKETVRLAYTLQDFTGTSSAFINIDVTDVAPVVVPERPTATPDEVTVAKCTNVEIPVLDNDTFTDLPSAPAGVILEGQLPDGVTAVVTDDRTVLLTFAKGCDVSSFTLTYRLIDDWGTDAATVTVNVTEEPPVVEPPVVVPPVVAPPTTTQKPPLVGAPKTHKVTNPAPKMVKHIPNAGGVPIIWILLGLGSIGTGVGLAFKKGKRNE